MGTIALRGLLGRPAVTLSAAAMLAALAACGPHSPAAHARAGAGARAAAAPAPSPVTGSPLADRPLPGRPRRARPPGVAVLSATFISARTGWVLEMRLCHRAGCPRLALRKTTDHGRHWFAVPAPPAPVAAPGTTPATGAVAGIRFADPRDGWAFGPGLWATHDGGRTWHRAGLGGEPVRSLEAGGGRVIAVVAACPGCAAFRVDSSPVTQDQWRPLPGAFGTASAVLGGPAVTVAAGTGFVTAMTAPHGPDRPLTPLLLTGPVDGSAPWYPLAVPCPRWTLGLAVAATPGLALALACASEPGAGNQLKRAYLSPDDGRTWRRLASPPIGGYLDTVSITPSGTILLSGGRNDVYVSWDGGRTWHGTAGTSPSLERAYQGGASLSAAMTTDAQGFTLQTGNSAARIWFTYDGAHAWRLAALP